MQVLVPILCSLFPESSLLISSQLSVVHLVLYIPTDTWRKHHRHILLIVICRFQTATMELVPRYMGEPAKGVPYCVCLQVACAALDFCGAEIIVIRVF